MDGTPIQPVNIIGNAAFHMQNFMAALNEEANKVVSLNERLNNVNKVQYEKMKDLIARLEEGTLVAEDISNSPQGWELMDPRLPHEEPASVNATQAKKNGKGKTKDVAATIAT